MATYTNLNNEIFAQAALEAFVTRLLPLSAFSTNFSPAPVQKGDTVLVPLIAALTATTFGGSYAICGGTKTVVTVTINRHKHVPIGQNDLDAANSSEASLISFAKQQGTALALCVLQDIFSLVTTASTSFATAGTAVSTTALDVTQIRAARLKLNKSNVPMEPRCLILDAVPYDALLGVTNFVQAHMMGDALAIKEGRIPRALGFNLFETNGIFPTAAWSVMGFAAHAAAIAIAMRYLQPQPGNLYADARPVSDPETGLVIGLRDHYDNNTGTRYLNLEANYGYSVGLTYAARVINSAD
ncbi:MAG: hypothetical protein NT154_19170 [Verrucomicrobia bacterium]|nr:hypothetical protein [Verrucomicrobiota bacterium]